MKPYYESGGIQIFWGDCRDVWPQADVLICDPPYGIGHTSNYGASWRGVEICGDADTSVRDSVLNRWGETRPAAVFASWKVAWPSATRSVLIWDKGPAFGMGDLSFPWKPSWEAICIRGDGWSGRRDEGVLKGHLCVSWESRGRSHPHEKPVTLLQHLIGKAPPGDVLDPFMGSGTTLVAAKNLGRRSIGIEIEERYCEIAARRLDQEVLELGA